MDNLLQPFKEGWLKYQSKKEIIHNNRFLTDLSLLLLILFDQRPNLALQNRVQISQKEKRGYILLIKSRLKDL